jgi:hypothetical protein
MELPRCQIARHTGDEYRHTMLTRREPLVEHLQGVNHLPNNLVSASSATRVTKKHNSMSITVRRTTCIAVSRSCITLQRQKYSMLIRQSCLCGVIFTAAVLHSLLELYFALITYCLFGYNVEVAGNTKWCNPRSSRSVTLPNVSLERFSALCKLGVFEDSGEILAQLSTMTL